MAFQEQQINRLLATVALRIRQSFRIEDILNVAVDEVRQFLEADRVIVYRFVPDYDGVVIAESLGQSQSSMLGQKIQETGFNKKSLVQAYIRGRFQVIEDIYQANLVDCYFQFLKGFQIRANLVVPILQGEQLWGLLGVQQCVEPRCWQPREIELSQQITVYLAIALQQASLVEQLQAELAERKQAEATLRQVKQGLEIRVARRTAQLEQANKRLERELHRHKQTERALQESEARFQRVADSMPVLLWVSGIDGLCTFFNKAWLEFTGRKIKQELGTGWTEGVHPDDVESCLATYQSAFNARQSFQMEYRLWCSDGEYRWVLDSGMPRFNLDGSFAGYIGSASDISDRKLSEAERAKLIAILEATPDIVFTTNIEQQLHYLNRAGRELLGMSEGELASNIADLHPHWAYELIQTEGFPTAMGDGIWMGETAFISRDGQEIPFSQLLIAHRAADGNVNQLSCIARNISQQKQDEATLIESERRWRTLLDNVHLAVVGLDRNGKVEYVNPYFLELTEYTQTEVVGKNWFDFLPQYQKQQAQKAFQDTLAQPNYRYTQNSILTKAGEERLVAWNHTRLQNLQGEAVGITSIGEDITERYAIARMKDEFISVVSHELRTPLTSVYGALNLLSTGLVAAQSQQGQQVLKIAADNADRLVRLVNDILELERLESGKISLLKQWVKASELMHRAITQVQIMANRAGICLEVTDREIELQADGDRLIQVLTNLLSNAIKFSPRGSTVWLNVSLGSLSSPHPNEVLFTVQDQGRGIPADKSESIFERFHQVDASDSRQKGGTGLGLAICRSIVEQHGGQIWVESTLNEGSSFYFTVPLRDDQDDR